MNGPKKLLCRFTLAILLVVGMHAARAESQPETIKGYVLDSACAFTKDLKKPISTECAAACAKAGSPLVILADDGTIYWPISDATPARGQNERLMEFAGKRVSVAGKVYLRGGSCAIVISTIEASK
jgi:hypothetical protein